MTPTTKQELERPIWYITAANKVVSGDKGRPADAKLWCREGDLAWRAVGEGETCK